ncbi:MAG TPA: hypothetical protein VHZ51_12620 [Ktedonobacteraceae bacterium]|nr:hypothetical protein [Ktedonobacteraceae bacterium]
MPTTWLGHSGDACTKLSRGFAITSAEVLSPAIYNCRTSCTVTKDCADRYFISILVEDEIAHLPQTENMIGADLGLKSFVVLVFWRSGGQSQVLPQG